MTSIESAETPLPVASPRAAGPTDPFGEAAALVTWVRDNLGGWLVADGPATSLVPPVPRPHSVPPTTALPPSVPRAASVPSASAERLPLAECAARLAHLADDVDACRRCRLGATRNRSVFGVGSPRARLFVVGEAPGADEDAAGEPFVGRAGQLLDRMLAAIGLSRQGDDVYIANVLKCRPPANRDPMLDEVGACRAYLDEQLRLVRPEIVLAMGAPAARTLLATNRGIASLRGRFMKSPAGWRVMPTWHPAYLLRTPEAKRDAWQDLQKVAAELGLAPRGS